MSTKTISKSTEQAREFLEAAREHGFTAAAKVSGTDAIVTLEATFAPGDRDAYVKFDSAYHSILLLAPVVTYGSTWGTTGGTVGGHAGLSGGYFRICKSGVSKRFASALIREAISAAVCP